MRLIDADALEHEFMTTRRYLSKELVVDAAYTVNKAPTIDAVPVVRCGECVHYDDGVCDLHSEEPDQFSPGHSVTMFSSDFCSYGERKDGEG